jgi:hypothetical protein
MKVAYTLEVVALLAVGLGSARSFASEITRDPRDVFLWLRMAGGGFLPAAALVGCLGVWAEYARGRSPRPWGLGRWIWAMVGLYLLARAGAACACNFIRGSRDGWTAWETLERLPGTATAGLAYWFLPSAPYLLIALAATHAVVVPGPRPRPDAREWAGRVFGASVVSVGFVWFLRMC